MDQNTNILFLNQKFLLPQYIQKFYSSWLMNYRNFFPIFQLGCFKASFGSILDIFLFDLSKNGPPEAVNITLSMDDFGSFFINFHIEKCSESIGIKLVLCFINFFIISHPQIMVSLLAISIFLSSELYLKLARVH